MIKYNCSIFCIIIFLFVALIPGMALEFDPDGFGAVSDYLDSVYGKDDNAGLTAFPVLNIPMGGRSEGMAGAFAAVADDISFLEFNPAGSSMLKRSELAFFHNNWIADTKIEAGAFASRYKNLGFGAGAKWLYTPFTEYNLFGDRVSKGYYSEAVAVLNASYNFFPGYYFSGVSVGINLKGAFRFVPDFADDNDNIISGSGRSQSAAMAMGDIGALTRFDFLKPYQSRDRNTSFALVMRNLGPPSGTSLDDPYKDALPTVMVAALAYKPLRPLLFSFDFSVPLNMTDPSLSEKPYWALGFAADVTSFLSMRAGFQSKTGNVRLTVGSAVSLKKISLDVNYALDLVTQLQPLNRVSLGVRLDLGDQGRGSLSARVDALYLEGLDAYAVGNHDEAERNWEEALQLDPKFAPAKESLAILRHARSVEQRINDLQRLEY
jgi:tetratricopeptide (TPR) repeat protein